MFSGFNDIGLPSFSIDTLCIAALRQDRLQHGCPKFPRFFNHKIRLVFLDRRKKRPEIAGVGLRARLAFNRDKTALLAHIGNNRMPFAIPAVKKQERMARHATQDIAQIMGLI